MAGIRSAIPVALVALALVGAASAATAQGDREAISSERVVVRYWPENERKARITLSAANAAVDTLEGELRMRLNGRIRIDVARSHREFQEITGEKHGNWVLGQAFYDRNYIVVKAVGDLNLEQLVAHEVTHIMLGQKLAASGVDAPRWLHEGLASYTAGQWTGDDMRVVGEAAVSGTLLPIAKLDEAFGDKVDEVSLAYAESYTLVRFLVEREGASRLGDFVEQLARTGDVDYSLVRTYEMPVQQLERLWMESVREQYTRRGLPIADDLVVFVAMGLLFIIAVIVQRRKARRIRERLQEEEELQRLLAQVPPPYPMPPLGDCTGPGDEADADDDGWWQNPA